MKNRPSQPLPLTGPLSRGASETFGKTGVKTVAGVILLLLVGCAAPRVQPALPIADFEAGNTVLVGRLGRPLGTVCRVEVVVVEVPPKMKTFGDMGRHYGLRVDKVDGKALDRPVISRFEVNPGGTLVKLAPNDLALDHLISTMSRSGEHWTVTEDGELTKAQPVSPEEAERLRVGYVGSRHTLLVYETAEYWGRPKDIPEKYGFVFSVPHDFHLAAHLVVFAAIMEKKPGPAF